MPVHVNIRYEVDNHQRRHPLRIKENILGRLGAGMTCLSAACVGNLASRPIVSSLLKQILACLPCKLAWVPQSPSFSKDIYCGRILQV